MSIDLSGAVTTALSPIAETIAALGGAGVAWGWALLLGGFAFRLLQVPLLVRVAHSRLAGGDGRSGSAPGLSAAVTVTQLGLVVAVWVWARDATTPAASEGFYAIGTLAGRAVTSGWGALVVAGAVVAATVAMQAPSRRRMDDRQRWFTTRVAPIILLVVTLFLPPAVLLFWLSSTLGVVAVQTAVERRAVVPGCATEATA